MLSEAKDALHVDFFKVSVLPLNFGDCDLLAQLVALSLVCRRVDRSPLVVDIGLLEGRLLSLEFGQTCLKVGAQARGVPPSLIPHVENDLSKQGQEFWLRLKAFQKSDELRPQFPRWDVDPLAPPAVVVGVFLGPTTRRTSGQRSAADIAHHKSPQRKIGMVKAVTRPYCIASKRPLDALVEGLRNDGLKITTDAVNTKSLRTQEARINGVGVGDSERPTAEAPDFRTPAPQSGWPCASDRSGRLPKHSAQRRADASRRPCVASRAPPAGLHWRDESEAVMFERFTVLARQAVVCARYKAGERNGDNISTQDLLGGLMMAAPNGVLRFASQDFEILRPAVTREQMWKRMRDELAGSGMSREIPSPPA